jgi:glutathione peroxidase
VKRRLFVTALVGAAVALTVAQPTGQGGARKQGAAKPPKGTTKAENKKATAETATSALDFTAKDIDGKDVPLSKYKGKVVLIVNVASKCGFTPQYAQLEALHEKYAGQGLAILGFPANDFHAQEPGTNAEIKQFCTSKYGVKFDMFGKVVVKGPQTCELYKFLTSKEKQGKLGGEIQWNFTKFLIGRDGQVIDRFEPRVKPDDPKVITAIETALKAKRP